MKAFARFIVKKSVAWTIVIVVLGISALAAFFANRVIQDDDVLAFLPRKNPEVGGFYEVSDRFGSLDVALVGIESEDVFDPDFLRRLQVLTKLLNETPGLEYSLSLTSVEDFATAQAGGTTELDYLVREIPTDEASKTALREKVLSRDHVIGNLVSSDGKAVMIYVFASPGTAPRDTAAKVRHLVEQEFPNEKKYWGGAPFISTYIYDVTQSDIKRLAPWACLAIAVMVLLSFKDLLGTGLSLLTTILGVVFPLGLMGFLGVHTNIVLGSMPVILFGLGSAYGVHILTRFYALAGKMPREAALVQALEDVGPSVLGSGITTVFGLLSFVMMDIKPMRTFGIFTAIGLTIALVLAITFVPAVLAISPMRGKVKPSLVWVSEWMAKLSVWVQRNRVGVGVATVLLTLASAFYAYRVDSRMDTAAFFDEGSPPAEADAFMRRHFGGSQFIQIQVEGDMTDPAVLREVQLLGDRISVLDGVSSVTNVAAVVAQVNEAMGENIRHVPNSEAEVRQLYVLVTGKRIIAQTVTEDRKYALVHVKVVPTRAAEVEKILKEVERVTKETLPASLTVASVTGPASPEAKKHRVEIVASRIASLAVQFGTKVEKPAELRASLEQAAEQSKTGEIEKAIATFIKSKDFDAKLPADPRPTDPKGDFFTRTAKAVAALGPPPPKDDPAHAVWRAKVKPILAAELDTTVEADGIDDGAFALETSVPDMWVALRAKDQSAQIVEAGGLVVPDGPKGERLRKYIGYSLLDLDAANVILPSGGERDVSVKPLVTGLPVLYRGLSASVFNNQWNSLWFALVLVIGLKALLFRSVTTGLLSSVPTLLTLLFIYGGMGLIGVHLDIGTSMLASLIIGAGDDYAVQFLWSWSVPAKASLEKAATIASLENGAGIWTNAAMVAVGFYVLTLGEARPLQNVGGLTAGAMIAAALATFIVTPLLARRKHYAPVPAPQEVQAAEPANDPSHDVADEPSTSSSP